MFTNDIWKFTFNNIWPLRSLIHNQLEIYTIHVSIMHFKYIRMFLGSLYFGLGALGECLQGAIFFLQQEQFPCPVLLKNHPLPRAFNICEDERAFKQNKTKQSFLLSFALDFIVWSSRWFSHCFLNGQSIIFYL